MIKRVSVNVAGEKEKIKLHTGYCGLDTQKKRSVAPFATHDEHESSEDEMDRKLTFHHTGRRHFLFLDMSVRFHSMVHESRAQLGFICHPARYRSQERMHNNDKSHPKGLDTHSEAYPETYTWPREMLLPDERVAYL